MEKVISIISICFSGITLVVLLITFFTTRKRDTQKETADDVTEIYSLREGIFKANIKLDTVCTITSETRDDVKGLGKVQQEHGERIAALEKEVEMIKKQMEV
jgi:hypothetical protein